MTTTEDYWRAEYYRERGEKLRLLTMLDNLRDHLEMIHGCKCEKTRWEVVPSIATKERGDADRNETCSRD